MKQLTRLLTLLALTLFVTFSLSFTSIASDIPEGPGSEPETEYESESETETETESETEKPEPQIPFKVNGVSAKLYTSSVELKWYDTHLADRYEVYETDPKTGKDTYLKTVRGITCKISNVDPKHPHTYRVRAMSVTNDHGELSNPVTVYKSLPAKPTGLTITRLSSNNVVYFKWNKVPDTVSGVELCMYDELLHEYLPVKKPKKSATTTTVTGLKKNETYRFVLRTYKMIEGHKVYSPKSTEQKIKIPANVTASKKVRAPHYRVIATRSFTATIKGTNKKITVANGTRFTISNVRVKPYNALLPNGKRVTFSTKYFRSYALDSSAKNDYSKLVKEQYINRCNYSSPSKYLIWVSEYKFKVNIFYGSRAKWKLVQSFACCSGAYSSRTASGLLKILKKSYTGKYGTPYLWFSVGPGGTTRNPNGCAFHQYVDGYRNAAVSHGCVRISNESLYWMYNHIPVGTTVWVH